MSHFVVEQRIEAPPEVVYGYLTESEKWSRWQGVAADLDARVGGLFSMMMGNGMAARGEFVELVPARRVVFTWGWVDRGEIPPGSSRVEIDLHEDDGGTRLVLTHHLLPPDEVETHRAGWAHYLPRLAQAAEGGEPGPDRGPSS